LKTSVIIISVEREAFMENSNKETQQDKRNRCLSVLAKVFVAGIANVQQILD